MKPSSERDAAPPATVAGALQWAARQGLDRVDAHALLTHLLGCDRAWLIAHDTDALPGALAVRFVDLCHARAEGAPVA